jgi:catechol 2,3-dioxygenase-like lactoylglutathione lyase family enzyme
MVKFDHMTVPVSDYRISRDWYVTNLGFKVEFENEQFKTAAIQDDAGFTIFLQATAAAPAGPKCSLTFQVKDVDQTHQELVSRDVKFINPPSVLFWGYGAELADPDGYVIRIWDEVSMREKGGSG